MEKTAKQKAIRKAYGKYWEQVKEFVDENGRLTYQQCWGIWGDGIHTDSNFYTTARQDEELGLENDMETMTYRPKSLAGIEDNNGWIMIEDGLPDGIIECYLYDDDGDITYFTFGIDECSDLDHLGEEGITHYQPIVKPKAPIY